MKEVIICMKTLIAVPCMDTVHTGFAQSLLHLIKGDNVSVCFRQNSLVYDSRNLLSLTAIEQDFDRVMWLDSDMMFSPHAMRILQDDINNHPEIDMVTGVYFKRSEEHRPVIYDELDVPTIDDSGKPVKHIHEYVDYPRDSLFPVHGCGFGCVLTTTRLLKEVWDAYGPAFAPFPWAGEDIAFCHRVNQLGHTIWCDSNVTCGHIGQFVYTEDMYQKIRDRIRGDA